MCRWKMSNKKDVIISGTIALAVAILIIVASMFAGITPHQIHTISSQTIPPTPSSPPTQQSMSFATQASSASSTQAPVTSTTASTTQISIHPQPTTTSSPPASTTTTAPSQGVLTIMLTDPPKLPPDVTAVYITYDGFSLHIAGAGGESGWVPVPNVKGTIELTGLVNVSQTIASVPIEKGKYNQIRFNVTRALVTYNGKNYTAIVRTEMLTIKIEEGGIVVNASKPAYTLIDVQPTVFNLGNASNPFFVITAAAKAVPVPPEELKEEKEEARRAGYVMKLKGKEWWENIRKKFESSRISIVSASLSKDSLNVEVKNVGNEIVYLKLLIVSPILYNIIPKEVLEHKLNMIVPHFLGAEVFIITEDGKPVPVKVKEIHEVKGESSRVQAEEEMGELFGGRGYALKPGESVKLSYTGTIAFNFTHKKEKMPIPIFQGEYLITVVGENAVASKIVNMSQ